MFIDEWNSDLEFVEVQTSGSTGVPKVMRVEKRRMVASARMTLDFLRLERGDTALLCLPDKYIAGKMMVVRSIIGGLRLISVEPCGNPLLSVEEGEHICFAAFTPMQVYNMLGDEVSRRRFEAIDKIIIGGGAVSGTLAEELRWMKNEIWSTYGMTETLSHIAMRPLSGAGASDWYETLKGVNISTNGEGCMVIDAPHVAEGLLETNDIVEIREDGRFKILGRRDNVVCSGGVKMQIEQMEQRIAVKYLGEFALSWVEDERLGQALVLVYTKKEDREEIERVCGEVLEKIERPKRYIWVEALPYTETGKIARGMLRELIIDK
ncbi:MAG: AMP-binding protein [Bacteroidia bacterium]|nr:AMP-binding protein [Bacteroidia bacterium]